MFAKRSTTRTIGRTIGRSEEVEQARFVRWTHKPDVRKLMPLLRWLHHSPNGGQRSSFTGAQMTALGVKKGFPDLILPCCSRAFAGLAMEFKRPDGKGKTTDEQIEWLEMLTAQGWACYVVTSAEAARDIVCSYFEIQPQDAPEIA